jgi:hypothetical protein
MKRPRTSGDDYVHLEKLTGKEIQDPKTAVRLSCAALYFLGGSGLILLVQTYNHDPGLLSLSLSLSLAPSHNARVITSMNTAHAEYPSI